MPETKPRIILTHQQQAMEVEMVGQARWAEIRRLHEEEGQSISAIARCMELDRLPVQSRLSGNGADGNALCMKFVKHEYSLPSNHLGYLRRLETRRTASSVE